MAVCYLGFFFSSSQNLKRICRLNRGSKFGDPTVLHRIRVHVRPQLEVHLWGIITDTRWSCEALQPVSVTSSQQVEETTETQKCVHTVQIQAVTASLTLEMLPLSLRKVLRASNMKLHCLFVQFLAEQFQEPKATRVLCCPQSCSALMVFAAVLIALADLSSPAKSRSPDRCRKPDE